MYIQINDPWTGLLVLCILAVGIWLLAYTAVRIGVDQELARSQPQLVAETTTTLDGVRFAITNIGRVPAFDVTVQWAFGYTRTDRNKELARTSRLDRNHALEWTIAEAAGPEESQSMRTLKVEWASRVEHWAERRTTWLQVPVPMGLAEAR